MSSHNDPTLICPVRHLAYKIEQGQVPDGPPPETMVITYQRRWFEEAIQEIPTRQLSGTFRMIHILEEDPSIGLAYFGVGAAYTAAKLEFLIAWGVKRFISFGTAGSMCPDLMPGDIVLCDRAVRDEGVSGHYLPPGRDVLPCPQFTEELAARLDDHAIPFRRGATRTTDAFYRQTASQVQEFQKNGVITVEMEAASLFAVAQHRNVSIASMFVVSDTLADLTWDPAFESDKTINGWNSLLYLAANLRQPTLQK